MKGVIRFDGGARPTNPGHAAFAVVAQVGAKKGTIARYIGFATNNEAEYIGLIVGIKYAHFLGARELEIRTDSKLVMNHVIGKWQCKVPNLKPLKNEAQDLLKKLYTENGELLYEFVWGRRNTNKEADALCTLAITYGRNLNPYTPALVKAKRGNGSQQDPFESTRASLAVPASQGKVRHNGLSTVLNDW